MVKKKTTSRNSIVKYFVIFNILFLTIVSTNASTDEIFETSEHIATLRFFGDGQVAAFSLDLSLLNYSHNGKLEYEFKAMPFSFARQNGNYQYAFQIPVNLLSLLLSGFLTNAFIDDSLTLEKSPFTHLLMLPNSQLSYKFHKNFRLAIGANTEYLFYRDDEGYRGIQFAPYIGITYLHFKKHSWVGTTLHVTSTNFLNFDGGNPRRRIQLGIRLYSRTH